MSLTIEIIGAVCLAVWALMVLALSACLLTRYWRRAKRWIAGLFQP